jgi:hypothetical protein
MSSIRDDVPVLTEILIPGQVPVAPSSVSLTASTEAAWATLERDVREAVLKGLQGRLDLVLEQRVNDAVHSAVDRAMTELASEVKSSVRDTVRDIVGRAVAQEISRLRATRVHQPNEPSSL